MVRHMKIFLTILCLLILSSYSHSEEISLDQLVEKDGIYYEVNSNTPFTGSVMEYYENGQLKSRENFKDGKEEGLSEYFYENGELEFGGNLKEGKEDGLWEIFYENGQLKSRENYKLSNSKILKSTLDKMNQINFQSSLPHCLDQTPTSQVEWDKLWDDDGPITPGLLNNCQVAVAYDGKGRHKERVLFVGEYKNDKRNGNGVMVFTSGNMYEGQWNGWYHGKGIRTFKDGKKINGLWHDGVSLETKCESFGFRAETDFSKRCQEIMFNEYDKN